jgi:hypothetical protein
MENDAVLIGNVPHDLDASTFMVVGELYGYHWSGEEQFYYYHEDVGSELMRNQ